MLLFVSGATATLRRYLGSPFLGHLLVPGAGNSMRDILSTGFPWAVDNAAFTGFDPAAFVALLGRIAGQPGCCFVACPDVVGDAHATLALFEMWQPLLKQLGLPVALVGQDGLEKMEVPWHRIEALFVGGSTAWKLSDAAASLTREARRRGLWGHLGRCNSLRRLRHAYALGCDSVDGSAFSRWPDHHIPRALDWLAALHGTPVAKTTASKRALPVERRKVAGWLALPGWEVQTAHRRPGEYQLSVRYQPEPECCGYCGASRLLARGLRRHGGKRQRFRDLPREGQRVLLCVRRRRYRCLACCRTFLQPLPDMEPGGRLTRRLADYLAAQARVRSCRSIAREVGLDEGTVRAWRRCADARQRA